MPHSDRVSLWGCFCARGIGQAEIFVGEFDTVKYVDILQHNLIQTALHFYPNEVWWFQQDNAPQHTSNLAKRWFHNHGVHLIDFPPYSPDLNPIENLFHSMGLSEILGTFVQGCPLVFPLSSLLVIVRFRLAQPNPWPS